MYILLTAEIDPELDGMLGTKSWGPFIIKFSLLSFKVFQVYRTTINWKPNVHVLKYKHMEFAMSNFASDFYKFSLAHTLPKFL